MDTNTPTQPNTPDSVNTVPTKTISESSTIFGVSLRGIITIMVIGTVCIMSVMKNDIKEPLYTLAGMVVAFYFGHQQGLVSNKK
jgi:hypothetical protein